jgi:hypothetical protein
MHPVLYTTCPSHATTSCRHRRRAPRHRHLKWGAPPLDTRHVQWRGGLADSTASGGREPPVTRRFSGRWASWLLLRGPGFAKGLRRAAWLGHRVRVPRDSGGAANTYVGCGTLVSSYLGRRRRGLLVACYPPAVVVVVVVVVVVGIEYGGPARRIPWRSRTLVSYAG